MVGRKTTLTPGELKVLQDLWAEGWETKRIARELDRPVSTVSYQIKKLNAAAAKPNVNDIEQPPDQQQPPETDDPSALLERSGQGRTVLWNILHDPSSPPQARVQAFNTLADSERWGLDDDMQRRLPPPLTKTELVGRQTDLLKSLSLPILTEVLTELSAWLTTQRSSLTVTVASSHSVQPSLSPDDPQSH